MEDSYGDSTSYLQYRFYNNTLVGIGGLISLKSNLKHTFSLSVNGNNWEIYFKANQDTLSVDTLISIIKLNLKIIPLKNEHYLKINAIDSSEIKLYNSNCWGFDD